MPAIQLTEEEKTAALAAAQTAKEERTKGTSEEDMSDKLLAFSPEVERALGTSLETALTKIFEKEVENRQKRNGESFDRAAAIVGDALDSSRLRAERKKQEDAICAKFLSGVFHRNKDMQKAALEAECKFLGRDTGLVKKFEERAMGAATAGDEFVPDIFATRVIENIYRAGVTRKYATIIPMTSDTLKVPQISTGLTAYEVAAANQITASDLVTAQLTLATRKLATITAVQNELLANANPTITPFIIDMAARALATKEDSLAFTGSGSTVTGLLEDTTNRVYLGNSSTSGQTTIASVDFDDLALCLDALAQQYVTNNARFFLHKKVLYYLQLLKNSADYYWKPASSGNPGTIHGFEYVTMPEMPSAPAAGAGFVAFGDLKNLYMGDRNLFSVTIGTEGTVGSDNLFEKDMSAVRVTEHVEFEIADVEGFSNLWTAAS